MFDPAFGLFFAEELIARNPNTYRKKNTNNCAVVTAVESYDLIYFVLLFMLDLLNTT